MLSAHLRKISRCNAYRKCICHYEEKIRGKVNLTQIVFMWLQNNIVCKLQVASKLIVSSRVDEIERIFL